MRIRLLHPAIGAIAFPLKPGGTLVIGRAGSMADVEITWDPRISRRHCRIWEERGQVWFQDLSSRNGSWIGNDRVSGVTTLELGGSVLIGETILIVPEEDGKTDFPEVVKETQEWHLSPVQTNTLKKAQSQTLPPRGPTVPPRRAAIVQVEVPVNEAASAGPSTNVDLEPPSFGNAPPGATLDLRNVMEPSPPARSAEPKKRPAIGPRFVSGRKVLVQAKNREDLRDLWRQDLSKGGLFVVTRTPPSAGTAVDVDLVTPAGTIKLSGTIVHVLNAETAASMGGHPGVGVQFTNLDPATRDAIQQYIEGLSNQLEGGSTDLQMMSDDESDAVLQVARKFLREAEKADFYRALGLAPGTSRQRVDEVTAQMHRILSESGRRMAPPQAARIEAALNVLARARRILTHPEGRLEYDFRHGYIRAPERIQNAREGNEPTMAMIRDAWARVYPERVDRAALLTRRAFAARQRADLAVAIDNARAALDLNPFFEELRQTLETWEQAGEIYR